MATEEVLHILISPETYKMGKSNILMSHANFLEILKKLYNLEILARQKQDLRKRLHKLFASVLSDIDSIQNQMPKLKIPKNIHKEEQTKTISKRDLSKQSDIEEELVLIQEKLRELNG